MLILKALVAILLPVVVFLAGVRLMSLVTNRPLVIRALDTIAEADRIPLNQRWWGYDKHSASRHWNALVGNRQAAQSELRFLELDLAFPFFYGAALAIGTFLVWSSLGRPLNPGLLLIPILITVLADWTENTIQWWQLSRLVTSNGDVTQLSPGWIQIASLATKVKLISFTVSGLVVVTLVIAVLAKAHNRNTNSRHDIEPAQSKPNSRKS